MKDWGLEIEDGLSPSDELAKPEKSGGKRSRVLELYGDKPKHRGKKTLTVTRYGSQNLSAVQNNSEQKPGTSNKNPALPNKNPNKRRKNPQTLSQQVRAMCRVHGRLLPDKNTMNCYPW